MPKKNKKPRSKKIVYESVGVSRWNLCQKLASLLYHSNEPEENLIFWIQKIEENGGSTIKK
jgi:hypothetical protein